jgi:hypothetical protein
MGRSGNRSAPLSMVEMRFKSGSAAEMRLNSFHRLNEDGALEHLAGGRGRGALGGDEDAQVDEPGTCDISSVGCFDGTVSDRTYRS